MSATVLSLIALTATLWVLGGYITHTALTALGHDVGYVVTMLIWPFAVVYSVVR